MGGGHVGGGHVGGYGGGGYYGGNRGYGYGVNRGYGGYGNGGYGLGLFGLGYGGLGYGGYGYGGYGNGYGYGQRLRQWQMAHADTPSGYSYPPQTSAAPYFTGQYYEPGDGFRYPVYYNPATGQNIYYPVAR